MRRGWYKESHRHYLAAKGIKTRKYQASDPLKLSIFASGLAGAGQTALGSQDPTEALSKRMRGYEEERRKGVQAEAKAEAARAAQREELLTKSVERAPLSAGEQELMVEMPAQVTRYKTQSEIVREKRQKAAQQTQQKRVEDLQETAKIIDQSITRTTTRKDLTPKQRIMQLQLLYQQKQANAREIDVAAKALKKPVSYKLTEYSK